MSETIHPTPPPAMTPERRAEIAARLAGVPRGPWHWEGLKGHAYRLVTSHSGRIYVMTFCRMGMRGAQPMFNTAMIMQTADELATQPKTYSKEIGTIAHPTAEFLASAPTDLADCLTEIDRLAARVAELEAPDMFWEPCGVGGDPDGTCIMEETVQAAVEFQADEYQGDESAIVVEVACARRLPNERWVVRTVPGEPTTAIGREDSPEGQAALKAAKEGNAAG